MSQNKKPYSDRRWREAPTKGIIYDDSQVTEEDRRQTERVLKELREEREKKAQKAKK